MKKIDSASGYLLGILNDILDMSKIESGKMKLVLDKCDIAGMIDNVTSIMDAKMNENDITFEQADDSANARKQGTGLRLERVDQVDIVEKRTGEKVDFTGRRVLAVEDNELNMEIIRAILEERGMTVEEAHDGQEAVNCVKNAADGYYDLILMDIMKPIYMKKLNSTVQDVITEGAGVPEEGENGDCGCHK